MAKDSKLSISRLLSALGWVWAVLSSTTALSSYYTQRSEGRFSDLYNDPTLLNTYDTNKIISLPNCLIRNAITYEGLSDLYSGRIVHTTLDKARLVGPWNIDPLAYTTTKNIGENINFDLPLKCTALDNIDENKFPLTIFSQAKLKDGETLGFADAQSNIVVSTFNRTDSEIAGTATHEFYHRAMLIVNNFKSFKPYSNKKEKDEFDLIMRNVLENIYNNLAIDLSTPPTDIKDLEKKFLYSLVYYQMIQKKNITQK